MRIMRRPLIVVVGLAATAVISVAGCSSSSPAGNHTSTPAPVAVHSVVVPMATTDNLTPNEAQAADSLHWVDWTLGSTVPPTIQTLRYNVEELGFQLYQEGYLPLAERVNHPVNATILVTDWLNTKAGVDVELSSARGVTAITLLRPNPTPDASDIPFQWIRCAATTGLTGNFDNELAGLQKDSTGTLLKEACHVVTEGN